ncbi:MAG: 2-oxoacid:acceptor oxidoreductase subunit alpha [Holophagales bacterium]|nr:2-oxoacid:acceptor oxidoreductase subunit alpha [Holophagales bacterium]
MDALASPPAVDIVAGVEVVEEHIVEFVSDSGEGAQSAGQMFGTVCAKMGNGVWTLEIIPAEIEPPHRSRSGASGNRIRFGTRPITNMGETADVVVAFNEQVLYSRIRDGALGVGTVLYIESAWAEHADPAVREAYAAALAELRGRGYVVREIPMERECRRLVDDPRRGKNMWAVGLLCAVYERDTALLEAEIERRFARKGGDVVRANIELARAGHAWALEHETRRFRVPVEPAAKPRVVMNGNQALAMGILAAGIEVCSMYPITPATSVSHHLARALPRVGGFLHQAEDEIAAIGFAIGASYAGKTAVTLTSGPGLALKTEFIGLAVMAEVPLVIAVVQRGGPSTGLPTRVEQGDLLAALFASPGDAPKIILAPSTIEECFRFVITARQLAETFRTPVMLLTDANLATGQQPFERPEPSADWLAPPVDQEPWPEGLRAYDWHAPSGLSQRPVPGQRDGCYVLTGLAHDEDSHVAYDADTNQRAATMRSRKLHTLRRSLRPPRTYGGEDGDLLVVCWGSTRGAVEEAVDALRAEGARVSSLCLRFLSPLEPGLKQIFGRFRRVMTVEINYSDDVDDPAVDPEGRRHAQLAMLLRASSLVDIGCWSRVPGTPLSPGRIAAALRRELEAP